MSRPSIVVMALGSLLAVPFAAMAQTHAGHATHATGHDPGDEHAAHAAHGDPHRDPKAHAQHAPRGDQEALPSKADAAGDPHAHHAAPRTQAPPASDLPDPHAAHRGHASHDPHAGHTMDTQAASATLPREPIPTPSDADRAAAFPQLHEGHAHGTSVNSLVRFNRFEAWDADPGSGQAWEGSAWIGGDTQRLWLRSEGEREHGRTTAADIEVLYGRGVSAWWDVVAGVRHDFAPGPSQDWAAFGVQGMAPYKFEVSATAYLGERGHSAFVAEAEYELLLTNRLVLQPVLEVELHGQDDPVRGIGSGLSSAETGLRLRYEVTRRFAPYVGLVYERSFGGTADYRRAEGEAIDETRWVAGVRWWF